MNPSPESPPEESLGGAASPATAAWRRPGAALTAPADPALAARLTAGWPAHRPPPDGRSFRLYLSPDGAAAGAALAAAVEERRETTVSPPSEPEDLALRLAELGPPPEGTDAVALPDFHRAFPLRRPRPQGGKTAAPPPLPTVASPMYLLARLMRLTAGRCDLLFAAPEAALLGRASDLLAGRGGACHLEVRREDAPPPPAGADHADLEAPGPSSSRTDHEPNAAPEALRRLALHAPGLRARSEAAEAAAAGEPDHAVGQLLLGSTLAERNRPVEAAAAFRRAAERDPALAAAHFELGKVLIRLDDLEAALAAFRRTTETLPEFASGWANAGAALGELERPAEGLSDLRRAADLDPLNHAPVSNLGATLRDLGRLEEAEAAFRRTLELAPDFVFGRYNLAGAVYLRGRYAEAVRLFEEARAGDPSGSARQRLLLAAARLAAGDEEGALAEYRATFDSLSGQMRDDMRTVAEWDLRNLARRTGVTAGLRRAADLLREVRG